MAKSITPKAKANKQEVAPAAVATPQETAERAAVKAEKDTLKAVAESGVVQVMFGLDPAMPEGHQFLEHCINGVIYRYPRGVMVEVPVAVFETIERKEQNKRMSMQMYSGFEGAGKQLNV